MTNNLFNLAAGGALIGVIASFWTYIKSVVWKFVTLFIQRVEIRCNGYLSPVLLGYLIRKYPHSRVYDRTYGAMNEHIREQERHGMVPYEEFGENSLIFWNGWLPFVFSQSNKSQPSAPTSPGYPTSSGQEKAAQYITLTFIRGTLDAEKIVYEATEERNQLNWSNEQLTKQSQQRFYIKYIPNFNKAREGISPGEMPMSSLPWYQEGKYRLIGYTPDQLGRGRREQQSALGNLIFPDRITSLIEEIKLWRVNRDWYHRRGIPWKRGWLLYGPPGTGKTALARAFAEDLDMPIWVYNLNELTNFMFMRNWIEMQSSAPSIALIEDIDNVFHGRVSINGGRRDPMSLFYNMGPKKNRKMVSDINSPLNGDSADDKGSDDEESMMGGMLSFDVFLNMLDGVERNDGIFTIITTNNLNAVDEALGKPRKKEDGTFDFISTRPGRVDKAIELTYMTWRDKIRMAQKILTGYPEAMDQIIQHMNANPELDETPAQFQERCAQLALQVFWQEQGGVLLNADRTLGSRYKEANQVAPIFSTEDGTFYPTDVDVQDGSVGVAQKGTFADGVGHRTKEQEFWHNIEEAQRKSGSALVTK